MKQFITYLFMMAFFFVNASAGNLTFNSWSSNIEQCYKGEFYGSFTFENPGFSEATYGIEILGLPSEINNFTVNVFGGNPKTGKDNYKFPSNIITCNLKNSGTFTVEYKGEVTKNGLYTPTVRIYNWNDKYGEFYDVNINVDARECVATTLDPEDRVLIDEVNGSYSSYLTNLELELGDTYDITATVHGTGFVDYPFLWQLVLNHSEGKYIISTQETTGMFETNMQVVMPTTLPDYDWSRDEDGNIVGCVSVEVNDDLYPQQTGRKVIIKHAPNKGVVNACTTIGSGSMMTFSTKGSTTSNMRYKKIGSSSWNYINNYEGTGYYLVTSPGEHYFSVQGVNSEGVGAWSDNCIVYSERTPPFQLSSTNTGMPNNWDVKYSDGADRAFKFKLLNRAVITATTDLAGTNFDTKIEIFDENKVTTGFYNDDIGSSYGYNRLASTIETTLDAGIYYLVVDGYSGKVGNFDGSVDFSGFMHKS